MDYLSSLIKGAKLRLFSWLLLGGLFIAGNWLVASRLLGLSTVYVLIWLVISVVLSSSVLSSVIASYLMQPIKAVWQLSSHLASGQTADQTKLRFGADIVSALSGQIMSAIDSANKSADAVKSSALDLNHNFIAVNLPVPLIVVDETDTIKFANPAAGAYIGLTPENMAGKNVYMVLDMSFPSEDTFEAWLKDSKQKAAKTARSWERVRLNVRDDHPARYFDLAAYFNRSNPDGNATMLLLFDHTKQYSQEDQAVSFIALSVHELRTPLTLLRGYIEVFEEAMSDSKDQELRDFTLKMRAQADQLTAYVNNILNVARVDDDQLELRLQPEDWPNVLRKTVESISIMAKIRGIAITCRFATDLPPVGVDRLSMAEVVNNLVDNAIKYSGSSKLIRVETYLNQEGLVETIVRDYGLGIPAAVMPNLFTKFYRDHRHRSQIGGTGLGLYLSKAIVAAHGGNLWVKSKEGQGSIFGFTLLPYEKLTAEQRGSGDQEIVRSAHGWIKNHSFYRR